MTARVHLLAGPAGCGKTARLVAEYRQQLATAPIGSLVWLAPTRRSVQAVASALLGDGLPACLRPGVMTFDQFAHQILQASTLPARPLSRALERRLIARIVEAAIANDRLPHLAAVARTGSFVPLVAEMIGELKRLEIWPDVLTGALRSRGAAGKDLELAVLYTEYQQALTIHQLYDAEGLFWSARSLLSAGQRAPFEALRHVVVDGFTDFTRPQLEILETLGQRVTSLTYSLPLEEPLQRPDLFAKCRETLNALCKQHRQLHIEHLAGRANPAAPALTHLERTLFENPRRITPATECVGIDVLAAAGPLSEVEHLAQRIKTLLLTGDATSGHRPVRPGDILLIFRSLSTWAPLVHDVFPRYGIPYSLETGHPLSASHRLRALEGYLRLARDDWPFQSLLHTLLSNWFRPRAIPSAELPARALGAEQVVRAALVVSGREALLRRVERWAAETEPTSVAGQNPTPAQCSRAALAQQRHHWACEALPLLVALDAALARLPRQGTLGQWADSLAALAHETGLFDDLPPPARGTDPAQIDDRAAWRQLQAALRADAALAQQLGEPEQIFDLAQLLHALRQLLRDETVPASPDEAGRVRILSAPQARTLSAPYVFAAGLSESSYPSRSGDHSLYADADRARMIEAGLPFRTLDQRQQDELLLFYEVVTRGTHHLTLSYPALNDKAEPLLPSPYVNELQRLFVPGALPKQTASDLDPIPARGRSPLAAHEFRLSAMAEALDGNPRPLAAWVQAESASGLADNVLAAMQMSVARHRTVEFGSFDGLLATPQVQQALAARFPEDVAWSSSSLEEYGNCPFRFFSEHLLNLEPLAEIELDLDAGERGLYWHDALARTHRRLNEAQGGPASPVEGSSRQFADDLRQAIHELLPEDRSDDPLRRALDHIARRRLLTWADAYLAQYDAYDQRWGKDRLAMRPAHFEASFGLADLGEDPLSTAAPIRLPLGGFSISLAGRIDRIDLAQVEGQWLFTIVDYKSGKRPDSRDVAEGRKLQLVLYTLAAQQLLADRRALPLELGYWSATEKGYDNAFKQGKKSVRLAERQADRWQPSEPWTTLAHDVTHRVAALVRGLRSGQFPVYSTDENCTSTCPLRTVCRIHQVRSLEKTWTPPGDTRC